MLITELIRTEGHTVIVEGKNDAKALRALGLENVLAISGKSIIRVVDMLPANNRVVVLTDFDKEGKKLAAKLTGILQKTGRKVDTNLRKRFAQNANVTRIEDLKEIMEDDSNGKITAVNNKIRDRGADRRRRYSRET